jgi:hypothetical protein
LRRDVVHLLKHAAASVWLATLLGAGLGLAAYAALRPNGGGVAPPAAMALLLALLVAAAGRVFDRVGIGRLRRRMRAAAAAERSGLMAEAEAEMRAALAALDSFLVAPRTRRRHLPAVAGRLARLYLARGLQDPAADAFVHAYLDRYPGDAEAAELWAAWVAGGEAAADRHEELAGKIGAAHPGNAAIQRGLARFFLTLERTDYAALKAYRRLWDSGAAPPEFRASLAALLRREGCRDEWSREVIRQAGPQPAAGPAPAPARALPETAAAAAPPAKGLPSRRTEEAWEPFRIRLDAEEEPAAEEPLPASGRPFAQAVRARLASARQRARRAAARLAALPAPALLRAALLVAGISAAAGAGWWLAGRPDAPAPAPAAKGPTAAGEPAESPPPAVTGPFTLQVAAYLKAEYAVKLVEELKRRGLDAYWTETASGDKRWYQVRISHFPDAAAARDFGRSLKQQGVVEDFYVANTGR